MDSLACYWPLKPKITKCSCITSQSDWVFNQIRLHKYNFLFYKLWSTTVQSFKHSWLAQSPTESLVVFGENLAQLVLAQGEQWGFNTRREGSVHQLTSSNSNPSLDVGQFSILDDRRRSHDTASEIIEVRLASNWVSNHEKCKHILHKSLQGRPAILVIIQGDGTKRIHNLASKT